jgi:regulator of protease activity HflC (stomatin/prohibitin superfamily)
MYEENNKKIDEFTLFLYGILVVVLLLVALFLLPFKIIGAGERGIVMRFGAVDRTMQPGFNFKLPIIERVAVVDVKTQKEEVEAQAASKDLQTVKDVIALNYNLAPDRVQELWKTIGSDYKVRVIDPAIQEAVKAATAKYTAEELITKRAVVRDDIKTNLVARLQPDYIQVSDVSIVNFDFSASFNEAIEAKVTAEQQALMQKNLLEKVKFEAEQKVATAKAEAESIKLQSDAADNEKYIELKRLEVQLKMSEKWDGKLPQNVYAGAPLPILNMINQ